MKPRFLFPALLICFFFSGAGALTYEVIWVRLLVLRIGSTSLGVSTVVTAFMAGLGLGAYLFGVYARKLKSPLRAYALLEVGIGLSAFLVPEALEWLEPLYRMLWGRFQFQFFTFSLLQFYFAFLLLLVPTTLMGATLPVLATATTRGRGDLSRRIGTLYGINTLGAVAGTLLTGFFLMPVLGMRGSLLAAVLLNLILAATAWALAQAFPESASTGPQSEGRPRPEGGVERTRLGLRPGLGLWIIGLSGFASMVYEVAWTRTLSLVIGSSVYGFTLVLATFLAGIALGSVVLARWADRIGSSSLRWIGAGQAWIGITAFLSTTFINDLPYWYTRGWHALSGDVRWLHLLGFVLSAVVILPATFGMGAAFPLVIRLLSFRERDPGQLTGRVYSANTVGAILGAFCGGFLLLASLGVYKTILVAVLLNLAAAAAVFISATRFWSTRLVTGGVCAGLMILMLLAGPGWNALRMSSGMFQYAAGLKKGFSDEEFERYTEGNYELLFYQDGINASVAVMKRLGHILLVINGKIDASSLSDLPTQLLSGHLPILLHPEPRDVCVLGMGSGVTIHAALQHPVRSVVLLEVEQAVVEASRYFEEVNQRPLLDPRAELVLADGRNYLTYTNRAFDVIISEPSNPWITGISNLFTQEFFRLGARRLRNDGIFAQWVHLYGMPSENIRSLLASFQSVFPHVQIFSTIEKTDLVLIGSRVPLPLDVYRFTLGMMGPEVAADLARVGVKTVADLLSYFKIGEREIRELAAGARLNTDDNALIEFSAPLYLASETRESNFLMLNEATAGPVPYLTGLEDPHLKEQFLRALEKAYRRRGRKREADLVANALPQPGSPSPEVPR